MSQHVNGLTDEAFAAATQTSATLTDLRRDVATSEGIAGFINAPYENRNCLGGPYNSGPYVGYYSPLTGYIYPDKTAKAIEILKKLQTEKVIDVKSVPRFIELVEAISAIL